MITGVREDLAPLVLTGPLSTGPDGSAFAAYRKALHAYLRGTDPERAARRALDQDEKAKDRGFAMPPAVLLSQLVEGDEESFDLALADALEAHHASSQVADRADDPDAGINLDILGLAAHARRRGWAVRVESPYLQQSVLWEARPLRGTGPGSRAPAATCRTFTAPSPGTATDLDHFPSGMTVWNGSSDRFMGGG
ncbi:immunity 49 family protein [Streptomyces fumanus]